MVLDRAGTSPAPIASEPLQPCGVGMFGHLKFGAILVAILLGCALLGCGHGPIHPASMSSAPANTLDKPTDHLTPGSTAVVSHNPVEDSYLYVTGYGRVPEGSADQAQDWLRAKRAAIDDAYAKLVAGAAGRDEAQLARRAVTTPASDKTQSRERISGAAGQAEIVSVTRLPDGSCQVLMRAPLSRINVESEQASPPEFPK